MRITRFVGTGLAIGALVVTLGACGGGGEDTLDLGGDGADEMVATDDPTPRFEPKIIEVNAGDEVTFSLTNEGEVAHNFSVSYIDIDRMVEPGETVEVTLPPLEAGELTFYDKRFQGEGMWGKIRVE